MELDSYLDALIRGPRPSPAILEIPRALFDTLLDTRDRSERRGVEYGHNLYFRHRHLVCGPRVRGTLEATDLDTDVERQAGDYIGDFHVHPYRERLGRDASIGPSSTDLIEMIEKRPTGFPIGVYFLFAGHILHLIILDRHTKTMDTAQVTSLVPDRTTTQAYQSHQGVTRDHPFRTAKPASHPDPSDQNYIRSLNRERTASNHLPGYARVFQNANRGMNLQAAAIFDYEYYCADLTSRVNRNRLATTTGRIVCVRQRAQGQSISTGLVCARCGKIHSTSRSTIFGRWHRCRKCKTIYCDWCGDFLWRPTWFFSRERTCSLNGCGGRTQLLE